MKKSVILLSSVLFLSLASCKTKKSQTTTSSTSASNTTNTQTYNTAEPNSTNQSGSSTTSSSSTPKTVGESESVSTAPKGSTKSETSSSSTSSNPNSQSASSTTTSNPKAVTEYETVTPKGNPTKTKGTTVSETEIVTETVTDKNCAAEIYFGSPGTGIDGAALDKTTALLDGKKIKYTTKNQGREGERRICMPLTELKEAEKKELLDQLKKIAKEGQFVSLSIR